MSQPVPEVREPRLEIEALFPSAAITDLVDGGDARWLASQLAAGHVPYARLQDVRRNERAEVVVFEVEVDAAQHGVHDIRPLERIAVIFFPGASDQQPEVLALREDFPTDAPHLNLRDFVYPRSLCLYDVPFREIRPQWTPGRYVALIREWLRLTSRGELHADDQPLERLIADGSAWVILPRALREKGLPPVPQVVFEPRPAYLGKPVWVGRLASAPGQDAPVLAAVLRLKPRTHGGVRHAPHTLADLHEMLASGGDDIRGMLREVLRSWTPVPRAARLLLVLLIPKQRVANGPEESVEACVLDTEVAVEEVGMAIDAWERTGSDLGVPLVVDPAKDGSSVRVALAYPIFTLDRDDLARQNGYPGADERLVVAIGAGALGSQVIMNAARAGQGRWHVIDSDSVLPHNLARHSLPPGTVGFGKAECLVAQGNALADAEPVHRDLRADVLAPGPMAGQVAEAFSQAQAIVDLAASVTVARSLVHDVVAEARRVSLFLSPSGFDLTLLCEDAARATPLDALEMQYYRAVARNPQLEGVFDRALSQVRYGRSCRDVSVALPQALVSLHAGIGTLALDRALLSQNADIRGWRVDPATLAVSTWARPPARAVTCEINGWRLVTDEDFLWRLAELRAARLPSETGGVLVGCYDLPRRIIYVVDTVPSPPDSKEYPSSYTRGVHGLMPEVERIRAATAGQLHYIGEWHSHPVGHTCNPSGDDLNLFDWLTGQMRKDGLPPLMIIAGDGGLAVPYLGAIDPHGRYPATLVPEPRG